MIKFKNNKLKLLLIAGCGILPAIICQFFVNEPTDRYIHIESFRYGKSPSVIRCNRGDRLHLTFSTKDTGHSFFLEEFDMDVKVTPAREDVAVFRTSDPTNTPYFTKEVTFIARHPGLLNYIVAKSNYRCHTWCGPMHAFEQGKLIILPNTLLIFSLGSLIGIVALWLVGFFKNTVPEKQFSGKYAGRKDLLRDSGFLKWIVTSRWPQLILTMLAMALIYIAILTSIFGTKVSGRNLGVLMMWAIWLFALVALMTPFGGRIWCTICPLPFFGDWFQRRAFLMPQTGKRNKYNNRFYGLFLDWPHWLSNNWIKLCVFLILATFSTTMVAVPKVSGIVVLMLLVIPTFMSMIWGLRAFCRFICPISVFVNSYSRISYLSLGNRSRDICDQCKPKFCQNGSKDGWACPYGLNVGELKDNTECGLCMECLRSCTYKNVSLFKRPFSSDVGLQNISSAWSAVAIFAIAIIYSVLYLGHWPVVRDYVNIIDKKNWGLFGIYTAAVWSLTLIVIPAVYYFISYAGVRISGIKVSVKEAFMASSGSLLPLGLALWIAFVIPMLFVNITFIVQSISDPFGWGWDFFGTANIPWHQLFPRYIPWMQAIIILSGLYFSLRTLRVTWLNFHENRTQSLRISVPAAFFIIAVSVFMLFFFVN